MIHLASVIICLIVIASFALFAINQTNTASAHQQQVLNQGTTSAPAPASGEAASSGASHKSTVRKALDEASNTLTSPFSELFASSSSEWAKRASRLLLALVVYGFGLGFLGRMIRVRL